jgi:N-acetylmuramic acid 6-phosphate etherase
MKAGTAQKLVLNMLTTGAMSRLGYVYGNLMANVHLKNQKLVERGVTIVQRITGVTRNDAIAALDAADQSVPVALVMLKAGVAKNDAQKRLKAAKGNVRRAMKG